MVLLIGFAVSTVDAKTIEITPNHSAGEINKFFNNNGKIENKTLSKGDIVIFNKGNYNDLNIKIKKKITIKSKGKVQILGSHSSDYGISIYADSVKIQGLIIKSYRDGIYIEGNKNQIINNEIAYNRANGVYIKKGSENIIKSNQIHKNKLYGVLIRGSSNTISKNKIRNCNDGVTLQKGIKNKITSNTLSSNKWNGVLIEKWSKSNTITKNTITKNNAGIFIYYESKNTVSKNKFSKNKKFNKGLFTYGE